MACQTARNGLHEAVIVPPTWSGNADMEHLLEFLERQPSWLRRLLWDTLISFLGDDEGEFYEDQT
jgi:hypothetical protein